MRTLATLLLVALGALGAACSRGDDAGAADEQGIMIERGPSGFYGTEMPGNRPAPPLRLVAHGGQPFDLAAQRGKVVLVFFGYTNCPDVCPFTLADWRQVKAALGRDTTRVRFVFVTTDPERDTPEVAQAYARKFDPSFIGLSGSQAEIDAIQKGFMIASYREPAATATSTATSTDSSGAPADEHAGHAMPTPAPATGGYSIAHASRVFVIDQEGRWRLVLPANAGVKVMTADVRKLLSE